MRPVSHPSRILILVSLSLLLVPVATGFSEVTVMAPAVAQTSEGWIGVPSYITVWAEPGKGGIFLDTYPFTQVDTEGSARIAADVAASLGGVDLSAVDIFIQIRSDSPIIGGPSAGGTLSVAILASLLNRTANPAVVMTGTINPDGTIGPIGGVVQKAEAAKATGATKFLVPTGQTTARENPSSLNVVNIEEYAMEHWNLTVLEVDDLREAARWILGIEISRPGSGGEIDLERYKELMKAASRDMLDSAVDLKDQAETDFEAATLTYAQNQYLEPFLEDAISKISSSEEARENEEFYLSASLAFQSKINSTYVTNTLEYLDSQRREDVKEIIDYVDERVGEIMESVNTTEFSSVTAFECYAAAEKRAREAYHGVEDAYELYYQGDMLDALLRAAYVEQRAESALWWSGLCKEFEGDVEFNRTVLKQVSQQYIADLKYLLAYAESIAQSSYIELLATASGILDDVIQESENGAYAAAILDSLNARSYVNADLELSPSYSSEEKLLETLEQKVEREKEMATASISYSRDYGVNPILALSHFEFGGWYAEQAAEVTGRGSKIRMLFDALLELRYARLIAEMSPIISARLGGEEIGRKPVIEPFEGTTDVVYRNDIEDLALAGAAFLALGLLVGILLGRRGSDTRPRTRI